MKYEIITDNNDLLVLVVNGRVTEISHSISHTLDKIEEHYTEYMSKKKKTEEKAEQQSIEQKENEPLSGSLGKLFGF